MLLATVIAGGILLALLLLLALPVDLSFQTTGLHGFRAQFRLRCLFGLLHFGIDLPVARGGPARRVPTARKTRTARSARQTGPGRPHLPLALRQADFRQRCLRLARDLLAALHLHQLHLRLRLGLGDPADTGRLWAVMGPLAAWAQGLRGARVSIEPEFMEAVLEFQVQGRARLVPLQLLALVLGFVLSPAALRAWRRRPLRRG